MLSLGGLVLVPLIAFSLIGIALILERIIFWLKIQQKQNRLIGEFLYLYQDNPQTALPKLKQNSHLPIARIFLAALELERPTAEEFELALETAVQAEIPILKRFNTAFETIIAVAPLLGLLGTILGLIEAFSALKIGDIAATNTAGVSGGISDALITTAVGLLVAIITLLFANLFRSLYRRQLSLIQKYGGRLELLYRRQIKQSSF
ncbi:MAG: MotA/TolQ/ExbB proton channel family protein [Spirulinaceae cyanobacterium]